MTKITVIIPSYNASLLIERTIRSILQQTGINLSDVEVLVVDDCSTDGTLAIVDRLQSRQILVFRQERNQGPAAARNRGLCEARGEYVAFLDADDYWEPKFLCRTVAFLEGHREVVAVSVGQRHKIIGRSESVMPQMLETGNRPLDALQLEDFFGFWADHNHVCTGSVLMRTEVARAAGGQREDLRICEDLEFWALLATFGPWGFIPEVLFVSDGGATTVQQGWLEKNRRRWASAVPVEEWNRRIRPRVASDFLPGYLRAEGRIARNLCYSMIMSDRREMARQTALAYGISFPRDRLGRWMQRFASSRWSWLCLVSLLHFREYHRRIT